jgi:hypothetical protein
MKACQGPERKDRLRRKHRRDIRSSSNPLLVFRKAQRGYEKKASEKWQAPPPQVKRDMRLMIASKMNFLAGP